MKLDFTPPNDGLVHQYCWNCATEGVIRATVGTTRLFRCPSCQETLPRALVIDPAVHWWLDGTKEYWHETAGIFVRNPEGRFLFFERTAHPFGLTPPAGHLNSGETAETAGLRELFEETNIRADGLTLVGTDDIRGDECRRGADAHRWHTFGVAVANTTTMRLSEEGLRPVWLSLTGALARDLTYATRFVIEHHREALERLG